MTSDSAKWCPVHNTTHTINGLRLVTPQEAGYESKSKYGIDVDAVVIRDNKAVGFIVKDAQQFCCGCSSFLIPLPKPRTTRPHKRGEVKLGDTFRHKAKGWDKMVVFVGDEAIDLGWDNISYETLLKDWQKLTYDSEGREVLSEAGVSE